jgi:plasmid maintenance system killer protein
VSCYSPAEVDLIREFGNKIAADLFHSGRTKKLPVEYWQRSIHLLDLMDAVTSLDELQKKGFPPSLRLHKLKGERKNVFAIDIHKTSGWRITFIFKDNDFYEVKIEDYH